MVTCIVCSTNSNPIAKFVYFLAVQAMADTSPNSTILYVYILSMWHGCIEVPALWCIEAPRDWGAPWCLLPYGSFLLLGLRLHYASASSPSHACALGAFPLCRWSPPTCCVGSSVDVWRYCVLWHGCAGHRTSRGFASEMFGLTLWMYRCIARVQQSDDPADHLLNFIFTHLTVHVCSSLVPPLYFLY